MLGASSMMDPEPRELGLIELMYDDMPDMFDVRVLGW